MAPLHRGRGPMSRSRMAKHCSPGRKPRPLAQVCSGVGGGGEEPASPRVMGHSVSRSDSAAGRISLGPGISRSLSERLLPSVPTEASPKGIGPLVRQLAPCRGSASRGSRRWEAPLLGSGGAERARPFIVGNVGRVGIWIRWIVRLHDFKMPRSAEMPKFLCT